jgi:hypothetical protein
LEETVKPKRLFVLWRNEDGSPYGFDDLGKIDVMTSCKKLTHDAYSADGSKGEATCRVTVSKAYTDFDYCAFEKANQKEEMLIGVMRLHRGSYGILNVSWIPRGSGLSQGDTGVVVSKLELKMLCGAVEC